MEDSPSYVTHCPLMFPRLRKALTKINLKSSELKFIDIVRHPIARAIVSHYVHWKLHNENFPLMTWL